MFNGFYKFINVRRRFHDKYYQYTISTIDIRYLLYTLQIQLSNQVKSFFTHIYRKKNTHAGVSYSQSRPWFIIQGDQPNVRKSGNDVPKRIRLGASSKLSLPILDSFILRVFVFYFLLFYFYFVFILFLFHFIFLVCFYFNFLLNLNFTFIEVQDGFSWQVTPTAVSPLGWRDTHGRCRREEFVFCHPCYRCTGSSSVKQQVRNRRRVVAAANRSHRVVVRHGRRQGGRASAAAEERKCHVQLARQRCDRYVSRRTLYRDGDTPFVSRLSRRLSLSRRAVEFDSWLTADRRVPDETQSNVNTVSPIGPDELPPPYQSATQGGMPMVTCRVCQAMIDISGKRDQHVVKCCQCNEATVCVGNFLLSFVTLFVYRFMSANDVAFSVYAAHTKRPAWEEVRTMSVQLSANMQELLATYCLSKAEL